MVSEISGPIDGRIVRPGQGSEKLTAVPGAGDAGKSAKPAADSVSLTDTASVLRSLEEVVANTPVVDQGRGDALRQAITERSYEIDSDKIAQKLIELESQLPLKDNSE
jgi:negative regulator of flagellin synthesis FlgM